MTTVAASLPFQRLKSRLVVDPAVFAERLVSRDSLERFDLPQDDLLGLRNPQTGEMLFVNGSRFRRWMLRQD